MNGKAIELLKTFTEDEFREFGLFIKSPFYNKEKVQINFYEILRKYYPSFEGKGFVKEKTFKKIYPDKKYNDGMMRNVLSKTLSLAENFLALKNFQNNGFNYFYSLAEELSNRKQSWLLQKAIENAENLIEKYEVKDELYYSDKFLIEDLKRKQDLKRSNVKENIAGNTLIKMQENLLSEFLIKMFKNASYLLNTRNKMYAQEINTGMFKKLEEFIIEEDRLLENNLYLRYYFYTYKLAVSREEKYFYELRKILRKNYDELNISDRRNIYVILTNYCYVKITGGEDKFLKEHFTLLKENVEKGHYLTSNKNMSHIFYLNVIITGLGAGENNWVKTFMESHKEELAKANRENSYNLGNALYHYHLKEFEKALQFATIIETNDLSYKHQLKSFYLKIYFDMNEAETFYSHIDSYRHFISSDKNTSKEMGKAISNYITFSRQLFNIKNAGGKKDFELSKLKDQISKNQNLINKQWLLSRVAETRQ